MVECDHNVDTGELSANDQLSDNTIIERNFNITYTLEPQFKLEPGCGNINQSSVGIDQSPLSVQKLIHTNLSVTGDGESAIPVDGVKSSISSAKRIRSGCDLDKIERDSQCHRILPPCQCKKVYCEFCKMFVCLNGLLTAQQRHMAISA
jgi:hypothetical protein